MKISISWAVALSAMSLAAVTAANASTGFYGDTVSANYDWPTLGTVYLASGTAIAGPGVEFDNIGGFGVGISPSVDFSNTGVTVDYPDGFTLSGVGTFDGWVFTDLSKSDIEGVSLAGTNIPGLTESDISFDSSQIYVNTLGLGSLPSGSFISIDVSFVPEAATWALMLAGFAGLGTALRSRRARSAVAAS
jgi:hypothetical protein